MSNSPNQPAQRLVAETLRIDTLPETLARIQGLVRSPEASLVQVVAAIDRDPAIAAETLRLANSPFYGLKVKATSVRMACVVLGFRAIERLVVQASILDRFGQGNAIDELPLKELWSHSFRTALIARLLAICCAPTRGLAADEAYTCGLLHNVGKAAMLQSRPDDFARALRLSGQRSEPLRETEREVFGFCDADVLALLAERWNLGPEVAWSASPRRPQADGDDAWMWSALAHAAENLAQEFPGARRLWILDPFATEAAQLLGAEDSVLDWIVERVEQVGAGSEG